MDKCRFLLTRIEQSAPARAGVESGNYEELVVRGAGKLANAKVVLVGLPIPMVLDEMNDDGLGPGTEALRTFLSHLSDLRESAAIGNACTA